MRGRKPLLEVKGLEVTFYPNRPDRRFRAVCSGNVGIGEGELVGLVGESGCGKSLTARSLVGLLPESARGRGKHVFAGREFEVEDPEVAELRGRHAGMIFQEPASALNPVYTAGDQLRETIRCLRGARLEESNGEVEREALSLLKRAGLDEPETISSQYPHQLSGGEKQRVLLALALAGDPGVLIADEPATALDAPLRRQVIERLEKLAYQGLSVLFISHDLSLVEAICDRVVVMYSGYTVEEADIDQNNFEFCHPYSQGLHRTASAFEQTAADELLPVIEGDVPQPVSRPSGCPFHPRCPEAMSQCKEKFPAVELTSAGKVACWAREGESVDGAG